MSRYWYTMSEPSIVKLRCLNFTRMEPYVVIRRHELTPLFHPYFINYGFNKVTFIETLQYEGSSSPVWALVGFQFYLFITDFGFDVPHPE